ncbi:MAG: FAD-binding protein [Phycisphaerales bacterium]|nr:FAD-binding protein [Phycisphaerales bacterium]
MNRDTNTMLPAEFVSEVRRLGIDLRDDAHSRGLYSTDASIYQVAPIAVACPARIDQIPLLMKACSRHAVPVLPRGGGTSLAGQCVNRALVLDVSAACHHLRNVDLDEMTCDVEPGITIDDLNDRLACDGVFFAPDPSTARQANVGGCIGNNAAGVHSVLYGRTSENVISVRACLANGRELTFGPGASEHDPAVREITTRVVGVVREHRDQIRSRFPKTMRRSSGYQLDVILEQLESSDWDIGGVNLAPLLCGSEGTLAVTTGARLRLRPIPNQKGLGVLSFGSIDDAIRAVEKILTLRPAGVELLDDLIMDLARGNKECAEHIAVLPDRDAKAVLFVEFFGPDTASVDESLNGLGLLLPDAPLAVFTQPEDMAAAWKLRKAGEPLLHAIPGNRKPLGFVEDNAIPVPRLLEFVQRFRAIVEGQGTVASYYAHASVGVLHVRPLLDLRDPQDERAMHRIASDVADLAIELGGVPSGEHGDGRARGPFIERMFGRELLGAFREIKSIFDPEGLLNPGIIVDPQAVDSISHHTRIRPHDKPVRVASLDTFYHYKPEHGFAHAVELCNGAGVCRRKEGGVMCPSYQATLDERHSTRGRGNALRLALTGQIELDCEPTGEARLSDAETLGTLDLCLSCKGCKSECPSSVDIAKLKSEYLAQGYKESGIPARVRVMSHIHTLNRLGSVVPWLSNAMQRFPPVRSLINHAMGVHPSRSLPRFARPMKARRFTRDGSPRVVLLSDTFTTHNEPEIAHACIGLLEKLGYDICVVPVSDLGRAAISQGNLEHAVRDADSTLDRLSHLIEDESVMAFLMPEPSCLSAVCDDWADLKLRHTPEFLNQLVSRSVLPETFIERFFTKHPEQLRTRNFSGRIVLHGHCHQKSLWGDATSSAIFERLYPGRVRTLATGCCGMAGSFGYDANHYELSMKIGEQSLFPSVRELKDDDILIAPGSSCRHQIVDGTSKGAVHPIVALERLLF